MKELARKRYRRTNLDSDYEAFSTWRRKIKKMQEIDETKYLSQVQKLTAENIKEFWAFTKSLRKTNSFPSEMKNGNETYTNNEEIAEGFLIYFDSVHRTPNTASLEYTAPFHCNETFNFCSILASTCTRKLSF